MTAPKPPIPANVDLRDFQFMPLDVTRLRDSDLAAVATDAEFRAAVMLWCAAWHQVPAGSLPDDAQTLAHLAGLGRDLDAFAEIRDMALRGFEACSDGRLYHHVIIEKVKEAWCRKEEAAASREADRQRKKEARERKAELKQQSRPAEVQGISRGSPTDAGLEEKLIKTTVASGGLPAEVQGMSSDVSGLSQNPTANMELTGGGDPENVQQNQRSRPPDVRSMTGTGTGTETKEKNPPMSPANLMKELWNQICVEAGLAKAVKMPSARHKAMDNRLKEDFGGNLDQWRAYCAQIAASPFLTGGNERGWKADLDWVLKPTNLAKIVEGKYDDEGSGPNGADEPYLADFQDDLRRDYVKLRDFKDRGLWLEDWGPKPGEEGCQIKAEVMAKYGPNS